MSYHDLNYWDFFFRRDQWRSCSGGAGCWSTSQGERFNSPGKDSVMGTDRGRPSSDGNWANICYKECCKILIFRFALVKNLTLCTLDNFSCFCCHLTFFKINFSKNYFMNTIRVSNGLDSNQYRQNIGTDLGSNCLQSSSTEDKSHRVESAANNLCIRDFFSQK